MKITTMKLQFMMLTACSTTMKHLKSLNSKIMKKITLLLFAFLSLTLSSCSSDDDTSPEDGYMKVLYLSSGSAPGQPMEYRIYYGTAVEYDQVDTVVSEEVFNYYLEKFQAENPKKTTLERNDNPGP